MPLFEFKLKDINKIKPWGESPDLWLSWFGLTDSFYYLNIQGKELYRYSNEILDWWKKDYPDEILSEYVDYQVVRLYEDLMDMLPDILQSIPQYIFEYVNSFDTHQIFTENINNALEKERNDEIIDMHYDALNWLSCRRLDSGHLTEGPTVWFLRFIIRWNNENKEIDGIQPWSEIKGEKKYTFKAFIKEVQSFHDRLTSEMQSRVDVIIQKNPLAHVNIDIEYLIEENTHRKDSLENALKKKPGIDNWDSIFLL